MNASESMQDQVARLERMAGEAGEMWVLSATDRAAIRAVLQSRADLLRMLQAVWQLTEYLDIGTHEKSMIRDLVTTALDVADGRGATRVTP